MAFIYDLSDTWNNAGISFNGIKLNATDTASAAGSRLIDLQINGASKFTVGKTGAVIATGLIESTVGGFRFPDGTTQTTKATVNSVSGTGTVNGITLTGSVTDSGSLTLGGTLGNIANNQLTNSAITINGTSTPLGGSIAVGTVTSVSGTGTVNGLTLTGSVTTSGSLTLGGTLGNIANSQLTNSAITINGTSTALGSSISVGTVTSVAALTLGTSGTDLASSVANSTTTPVITLNVPTASASNRGALSSSDWSTFNAKQAALVSGTNIKTVGGASLLGSGDVGTIGLAYGGTGATTESGARTALGLGTAAVLNAGVAGGVATLDGSGTVPTSQLPGAVLGGLNYQGTWNASTNTPTLASSTGSKGYYYVVSTAGSTNLNGITDWKIGDWAVYDGTTWQKVDNTDAVSSVNGYTGAVVLSTSDVAQGTNLYFTQAAARDSVSAGTGISYDSTTGVITNSAPDQTVALTGAGTTTITGTYPNFTITSNDSTVGTVTSVAASGGTTGLTFTGSPITTAGTLTLGGTLAVANGGTGATTLTSGYVLKGNGTSAVSASVLYDDGTNTGIGTTSPSALFHISQNGGGDIGALVSQTNGGNGTTARYRATHGSGAAFNLQAGNGHVDLNVTSNHHLTFGTNDTERFRIGASGQFGIGGATYGSAGQVLTSGGASSAPTWTTPTTGTVTSVGGTGTVNGITLTGTVTSSGSLTLGGTLSGVDLVSQVTGTLPVANGGTGATTLTSGYLVKGNGTSAASASVVYDDGTNVGIGTSSPAQKLDVSGNLQVTGASAKVIVYNDQTIASINTAGSAYTDMQLDGLNLLFRTGSGSASERMRISNAGNVGIGISSPAYPLQVRRAGGAGSLGISIDGVGATDRAVQYFAIQDDAAGSGSGHAFYYRAPSSTTDTLGLMLDEGGNVGIGVNAPSARLHILKDGASNYSEAYLTNANSTAALAMGVGGSAVGGSLANNAYLWNIGNSALSFGTGATERMRITSGGNVGIGTDVPDQKLTVDGSVKAGLGTSQSILGQKTILFYNTSVSEALIQSADDTSTFNSMGISKDALRFLTQNSERMRIDSSGNVGIGTTSPSGKLQVEASNSRLLIGSGGSDNYYDADFHIFRGALSASAPERMRIDNNGNVGIGTTSPQDKLEVYGGNVRSALAGTSAATLRGFAMASGTTEFASLKAEASAGETRLTSGFSGFGGFTTFHTNGTERMRIDSSGNVGIGTSSPTKKLMLGGQTGPQASPLAMQFSADYSNGETAAKCKLFMFNDGATNIYGIGVGSNADMQYHSGATGLSDGNHRFYTNDTEKMRIDSSGNLLVGTTTSYGGRLSLVPATNPTTASGANQISIGENSANTAYRLNVGYMLVSGSYYAGSIQAIAGSAGAPLVLNGDGGNVGIGTSSPTKKLSIGTSAAAPTNGVNILYEGTEVASFTSNAATGEVRMGATNGVGTFFSTFYSNNAEAMRIDSSGNLLVGTTTSDGYRFKTEGTYPFLSKGTGGAAFTAMSVWNNDSSGDNIFLVFATEPAGSSRGSISYNRGAGLTAYNVTSDYRAKDIIGSVTDAGTTIDALKVYAGKMHGATIIRPMLIAHEAQEIVPYAVTGEKDAVNEDGTDKHQQMDHQSLVPLLIAEIQSLRARVAQLEGN